MNIRFAVANPELYRIATMGEGRPGSDIDTVLASSAFGYLRGSVQALMDQGIYAPGDPTTITLELWSAVHGIADDAVTLAAGHGAEQQPAEIRRQEALR